LIIVFEIGVHFDCESYGDTIEQIYRGDPNLNGMFIAIGGDDVREEQRLCKEYFCYRESYNYLAKV